MGRVSKPGPSLRSRSGGSPLWVPECSNRVLEQETDRKVSEMTYLGSDRLRTLSRSKYRSRFRFRSFQQLDSRSGPESDFGLSGSFPVPVPVLEPGLEPGLKPVPEPV